MRRTESREKVCTCDRDETPHLVHSTCQHKELRRLLLLLLWGWQGGCDSRTADTELTVKRDPTATCTTTSAATATSLGSD